MNKKIPDVKKRQFKNATVIYRTHFVRNVMLCFGLKPLLCVLLRSVSHIERERGRERTPLRTWTRCDSGAT